LEKWHFGHVMAIPDPFDQVLIKIIKESRKRQPALTLDQGNGEEFFFRVSGWLAGWSNICSSSSQFSVMISRSEMHPIKHRYSKKQGLNSVRLNYTEDIW